MTFYNALQLFIYLLICEFCKFSPQKKCGIKEWARRREAEFENCV